MTDKEQLQADRQVEKDNLKDLIVLKFNSIRRFCVLSGRDYHSFRNMMNRKPVSDWQIGQIRKAYNEVMSMSNKILSSEISAAELKILNEAIAARGLSMNNLAQRIGIPRTSIRDLVSGSVKKKNSVYDALTEFFDL